MRSLNETACQALLEDVRWDEPVSLVSLAILALIDVLVIAGEFDYCLSIFNLFLTGAALDSNHARSSSISIYAFFEYVSNILRTSFDISCM